VLLVSLALWCYWHEIGSVLNRLGAELYTALGIYKSMVVASMLAAQRSILAARLAYDAYFAKLDSVQNDEVNAVIAVFSKVK